MLYICYFCTVNKINCFSFEANVRRRIIISCANKNNNTVYMWLCLNNNIVTLSKWFKLIKYIPTKICQTSVRALGDFKQVK